MTHIDGLVKRARSVADHAFSGAPRFIGELADALESQSAELTRLRERNAELETSTAEAYQAVGMLIETIGADGDENVVRLQDILAYGKTQDGKDLLPFPLLSNIRAEKAEARIASLEATARELREALSLADSVYRLNCVAVGEPSSVLDAMQAALSASESVVGNSEG
jgi:hypothetical protein